MFQFDYKDSMHLFMFADATCNICTPTITHTCPCAKQKMRRRTAQRHMRHLVYLGDSPQKSVSKGAVDS